MTYQMFQIPLREKTYGLQSRKQEGQGSCCRIKANCPDVGPGLLEKGGGLPKESCPYFSEIRKKPR